MKMYEVPYGTTVRLLETHEGPPGAEVTFKYSVVKQDDPFFDTSMYMKVSYKGKTRYVKSYCEVEVI